MSNKPIFVKQVEIKVNSNSDAQRIARMVSSMVSGTPMPPPAEPKLFTASDVERMIEEALDESMPEVYAAWESHYECARCMLPWYRRIFR